MSFAVPAQIPQRFATANGSQAVGGIRGLVRSACSSARVIVETTINEKLPAKARLLRKVTGDSSTWQRRLSYVKLPEILAQSVSLIFQGCNRDAWRDSTRLVPWELWKNSDYHEEVIRKIEKVAATPASDDPMILD